MSQNPFRGNPMVLSWVLTKLANHVDRKSYVCVKFCKQLTSSRNGIFSMQFPSSPVLGHISFVSFWLGSAIYCYFIATLASPLVTRIPRILPASPRSFILNLVISFFFSFFTKWGLFEKTVMHKSIERLFQTANFIRWILIEKPFRVHHINFLFS